jgi:hypothetical protein
MHIFYIIKYMLNKNELGLKGGSQAGWELVKDAPIP